MAVSPEEMKRDDKWESREEVISSCLKAMEEGNVEELADLLTAHNINLNLLNSNEGPFYGKTLLMSAVLIGKNRVVDFLLAQPGCNILVENYWGGTALNMALDESKWKIAYSLIQAGANIEHATHFRTMDDGSALNFTPLLRAWYFGNQEAANQLITWGANLDANERLFNSFPPGAFIDADIVNVRQQIELSKQYNARQFGLALGDLCFQFMRTERIGREISEFLFEGSEMKAFNDGCEVAFEALSKQSPAPAPKKLLPIPRSLLFMGNFEHRMRNIGDELSWEKLKEEYNATHPGHEEHGYGLGAMVVYKPKP